MDPREGPTRVTSPSAVALTAIAAGASDGAGDPADPPGANQSAAWWPLQVRPLKGAPTVL
jgi:hypothetical protein